MSTDYAKLLQMLTAGGVEFVLIGGVAGTLHGSARATYDLDVVYSRSRENIRRLVATLAPWRPYLRGAPAGLPFCWDEPTARNGLNFTLTTALGDLALPSLPAASEGRRIEPASVVNGCGSRDSRGGRTAAKSAQSRAPLPRVLCVLRGPRADGRAPRFHSTAPPSLPPLRLPPAPGLPYRPVP